MALAMPVVWSDRHRLHEPGGEVWVGVRTPGTELPERAERIRAELERQGARIVAAEAHPDHVLREIHDAALLDYLAGAWPAWEAAGLIEDPGQDRVVPYVFPHPGLLGALPPADPAATAARAGRFAYDTMTLIGARHLGGSARRGRCRDDCGGQRSRGRTGRLRAVPAPRAPRDPHRVRWARAT